MDRRAFIEAALTILGGIALDQAIPRGRVWSFPTKIKLQRLADGGFVNEPKMFLVGELVHCDIFMPHGVHFATSSGRLFAKRLN